ncbi:hypothetical protein ACOI1H_05185 [Loktanella sp. DJP18]|uniref:hypothetical protein n=1 Tax=Loktanella sp. DJP18 TaxID=3409788 RepID=UPI003BB6A34B
MTSLALPPRRGDFSTLTVLSVAVTLLFSLGALTDPRMLDGVAVWEKPLHFALSFLLFFGTLALVVPRLSPVWRNGWLLRITTVAITASFLFEMVYISLQAGLVERSHFNVGDPFHALPLTLIVAGYLSSHGSHHVGQPLPGGAVVPVMGWSLTTGDLRPAHFVSIHAMQALPLLGFWLDRRNMQDRRILWGAAVLWSVLCLALFAQALWGVPLIAF